MFRFSRCVRFNVFWSNVLTAFMRTSLSRKDCATLVFCRPNESGLSSEPALLPRRLRGTTNDTTAVTAPPAGAAAPTPS